MSNMKINEHKIIKESIEYSGKSSELEKIYINCRFKDRPISIDTNMQYELLKALKESPVKITNENDVNLGDWRLVSFNIRHETNKAITTTLDFEKERLPFDLVDSLQIQPDFE